MGGDSDPFYDDADEWISDSLFSPVRYVCVYATNQIYLLYMYM